MSAATRWSIGVVAFGALSAGLISQSNWFALLIVGAVVCAFMAGTELRKRRRA